MQKSNWTINDIFTSSEEAYLREDGLGFMYRGKLRYPGEGEMDVAMKFTHDLYIKEAKKEYAMYSYLEAVDEANVELYGIPSVYYYGHWEDYTMIGITLLDKNLEEFDEEDKIDAVGLLIVCRQFMITSKYMHSRGIYHNAIQYNKIMFHGSDVFFIDYDSAKKMYDAPDSEQTDIDPREFATKFAKLDWKAFIQSIYDISAVDGRQLFSYDVCSQETDQEIRDIMNTLDSLPIDAKIKMILKEMAKYILGIVDSSKKNDKISVYDRIYGIIEMEIITGKLRLINWLRKRQISGDEFRSITAELILGIPDPSELKTIHYLKADEEHFEKKILRLKTRNLSLI